MLKIVHPVAGGVALLTIATFWLTTVISELFSSAETVFAVKTALPWGLLLFVPALAAAGGTGFKLANGRRSSLIAAKIRRTAISAANGLLVLVPSALFLAFKARSGTFDVAFYAVQALELLVSAVNIALLCLNVRDGFRMTGRLRPAASARATPDTGI